VLIGLAVFAAGLVAGVLTLPLTAGALDQLDALSTATGSGY